MFRAFLAALAIIPLGGAALADCANDAEIATFVQSYLSRTPARALGAGGDMDDALCTQGKLAAVLAESLGPVVGYKAGLTSKPAQDRFGVTEPVHGVLYRDMLLPAGAEVPAAFGTIPMLEADLLLVIGDAAINQATTPEEAMAHISAIRPFIELPDMTLAKGEPITGETLTAMGVAPRLGVMGPEIAVSDPAAMLNMLAGMTVTLMAADGTVLTEAPGAAVLGNPVNSVLWLLSKGITFQPGDVVSVGSFGPLLPVAKAPGGANLRYTGLPGDPEVSVTFVE
ncbi:fumarylacetoacetate hydrolase family protein [Salipiger sp. P9]|uniref:2-keto-4-pentenoate hydratase n=1 Tax=Salipiger pentaromativorans TaxID=2943193 RepID=UPI002158326D|nr:fumarylacetoacetate hydrolase family protein [Salipiger pentaromativorans]MCR8547678.1 fumarylacetoacetate hydrolase family protein [Salipiger pentaromativorans]